jgi:hypothetical protein
MTRAVLRRRGRARRAGAGWTASLLVPLALVTVLVRLDAVDPLVWGLAFGVATWLAWAATRFARAPLRAVRTAPRRQRWRRTRLHIPH